MCLTKLLSDIIFNYNDIVAKENEFDYKRHDIEIFEKMMSFVSEEEFINSITDFRSSGRFFNGMKSVGTMFNIFKIILKTDLSIPILTIVIPSYQKH